jgi:hypothetical protein
VNWRDSAACADLPAQAIDRLFFPTPDRYAAVEAEAKAVCRGCLVRSECQSEGDELETSKSFLHTFGIRAGEGPTERLTRRAKEPAHV